MSLVTSPWALALNELIVPGAIASLVNALLLATRRKTSSGAIAYPIRHQIRQTVQMSWSRGSTDLGLIEDKTIRGTVSTGRRYDDKQRARGEKGAGLDEQGDHGLVQATDSTWSPQDRANVPVV